MVDPSDFRHAAFGATRYSLVERARTGDHNALADLIESYMPALHSYLVFNLRVDPHGASDVLQDFLKDKILTGKLLDAFDPQRGRFRDLLARSLQNYLRDQLRKRTIATTDFEFDEPADEPNEDVFLVAWARELLLRTVNRLRDECDAAGRHDLLRVFEARFLLPACRQSKPVAYEQLRDECKLGTVKEAQNLWISAKRKYRGLLERAILEYAAEEEVDDELRELAGTLAGMGSSLSNALRDYFAAAQPDSPLESSDPVALSRMLDPERAPVTETAQLPFAEALATALQQPVAGADASITLRELLTGPGPPLKLLVDCKDFFKVGDNTLPYDVSRWLYVACLAAARVAHGGHVSKLSHGQLRQVLRWAIDRPGADPQIVRLMVRAIELVDESR